MNKSNGEYYFDLLEFLMENKYLLDDALDFVNFITLLNNTIFKITSINVFKSFALQIMRSRQLNHQIIKNFNPRGPCDLVDTYNQLVTEISSLHSVEMGPDTQERFELEDSEFKILGNHRFACTERFYITESFDSFLKAGLFVDGENLCLSLELKIKLADSL